MNPWETYQYIYLCVWLTLAELLHRVWLPLSYCPSSVPHLFFLIFFFTFHLFCGFWRLNSRACAYKAKFLLLSCIPDPLFTFIYLFICYFIVICSHLRMHISFEPYSAIQQSLKLLSPSLQHLNQWPIPPDRDATFIDLFY